MPVKAMVEVEVQLIFRGGGGWSDKTKLILISTLVDVVVEVEVELGNRKIRITGERREI